MTEYDGVSMRNVLVLLAAVLCVLGRSTAQAAPEKETAEIAILTPAVPATLGFSDHALWALQFLPVAGQFIAATRDLAHFDRPRKLTALARRDSFSPADRLSRALEDASEKAGRKAVLVRVTRTARAAPGPIRFDELPESPGAPVLLDVSVLLLNVWRESTFADYYPGWIASYRLVGRRGELIQPSRTFVAGLRGIDDAACKEPSDKNGAVVCQDLSPGCGFTDYADIEKAAPRIWGCFDKSFDELAARIVADLPKQ